MGRSPKTEFQIHVILPLKLKGVGEAISRAFGFVHKKAGSTTALFRSVLRLEYLLVPNKVSLHDDQLFQAADILRSVNDRIQAMQPFQLVYQHANGDRRSYNVRYAEVIVHEQRLYVDVWAHELDDRQPAELAHNRSFRIDRVDAIGEGVEGGWREGLDTLPVSFEILANLIHSYEKKPGDAIAFIDEEVFVSRHISSVFWFIREILPCGADCIVLEPAEVRDRVKKVFEEGLKKYG